MKEGSRKERITLNHGKPSELQRMLVPFSLFIPFNVKSTLASSVLLHLRQQSLFAKAVSVLILPTSKLAMAGEHYHEVW